MTWSEARGALPSVIVGALFVAWVGTICALRRVALFARVLCAFFSDLLIP